MNRLLQILALLLPTCGGIVERDGDETFPFTCDPADTAGAYRVTATITEADCGDLFGSGMAFHMQTDGAVPAIPIHPSEPGECHEAEQTASSDLCTTDYVYACSSGLTEWEFTITQTTPDGSRLEGDATCTGSLQGHHCRLAWELEYVHN